MSEKTLQHRIDGPEGAPVLVLGAALGTTWHMWSEPSCAVQVV
ncbi:3-oxoadipate enol-lactone hydrolase [Streptomyces sp. WZ-12]|nr:3-oxoadipate enol-lactone hydrolase [Streptomyces sp. WZ-12]